MTKHAQTNCLSVFDHFVGLALKGLVLQTKQDMKLLWFFSVSLFAVDRFLIMWNLKRTRAFSIINFL